MNDIPRIDPLILSDAYHRILELGMENLQRFRLPGRFDYLAIEIDHLHNLPHYMRESNVYVHAYYFCTTRPFYIEGLDSVTAIDTDFLIRQYESSWQQLREGLTPFAVAINMKEYTEKL
ncbi:hypothetical protein DTL42_00605 [Bremerella cremea]|uniref:Uncharacterized protein n=1 Tax=Bremerella cremea TaxID=1031537 RepID=A0A368KZL7_9BACT|nr:hypothetical protein [Bremerella cremea]RCS55924.1 hypothetical protein DTL42_00605 [Bremerella cremea]